MVKVHAFHRSSYQNRAVVQVMAARLGGDHIKITKETKTMVDEVLDRRCAFGCEELTAIAKRGLSMLVCGAMTARRKESSTNTVLNFMIRPVFLIS